MSRILSSIFFAVLAGCSSSTSFAADSAYANICQVYEKPNEFVGQILTLPVEVSGDKVLGFSFTSKSCPKAILSYAWGHPSSRAVGAQHLKNEIDKTWEIGDDRISISAILKVKIVDPPGRQRPIVHVLDAWNINVVMPRRSP
jgi:hypothetical protein